MTRRLEAAGAVPSHVEAEVSAPVFSKRTASRAARWPGRWFQNGEGIRKDPRIEQMIGRLELHRAMEIESRRRGTPVLGAPFESYCIARLMANNPTMGVRAAAHEVMKNRWELGMEAVSRHFGGSSDFTIRTNAMMFLKAPDPNVASHFNFLDSVEFRAARHFVPALADTDTREIWAFRGPFEPGQPVPDKGIFMVFSINNATGTISGMTCHEFVSKGTDETFSSHLVSPPRQIAALKGMQVLFSVLLGGPQDHILLD